MILKLRNWDNLIFQDNHATGIEDVVSLPVEERALIMDSILRSLNQPESEIDKKWGQ